MLVYITATIGDGLVARWTFDPRQTRCEGEISASRSGVMFSGNLPRISTETDRREVISAFTVAWECYRMLAQREERFSSDRITKDEVAAWLRERSERVVDVQFCETVTDALAREAAQ